MLFTKETTIDLSRAPESYRESPSENVADLVRIYPVVKKPPYQIIRELYVSKPSEISYLNTIFIRKTHVDDPSISMLTPISEKMADPQESTVDAGLKILNHQTSMSLNGFFRHGEHEDNIYTAPQKFEFNVKDGIDNQKRRATLSVLEVSSVDGYQPTLLDKKKKVDGFEMISSRDAINQIRGRVPSEIYGSSVMGVWSDIEIDEEHLERKDTALEAVCQNIEQCEAAVQNRLTQIVNRNRLVDSTFQGSPVANIDEASNDEVIRAYQMLKREEAMKSFRKYERVKQVVGIDGEIKLVRTEDKHIKNDLGNWLGKDVLYFAQVFADGNTVDFRTIPAETTNSVIRVQRLLRDVFRDSYNQIMISGDSVDKCLQGYFNRVELQSYNSPVEKTEAVFDLIRDLYSSKSLISVQGLFEKRLGELMAQRLGNYFGLETSEVAYVKNVVNDMLSENVKQSLAADPELAKKAQTHSLLNEIQGANDARLLILAAGVLPFEDVNPKIMQYMRFEAARSLAYYLKGYSVYPRYKELAVAANYAPFQRLVEVSFGGIEHSKQYILGEPVEDEEPHTITLHHRKNGQIEEVIVDRKPIKPFASFLRKSFETPSDEIYDINSYNVSLIDELDLDKADPMEVYERLETINQIAEDLTEEAHISFGDTYKIRRIDDKNTFNRLLTRVEGASQDTISGGKRAGSNGNGIIRRKFVLEMVNKYTNEVSTCEFAFFPYAKINSSEDVVPLGLVQKREDDENYKIRRLISPMTHPDLPVDNFPSKYQMDNPTPIYGPALWILNHKNRTKK